MASVLCHLDNCCWSLPATRRNRFAVHIFVAVLLLGTLSFAAAQQSAPPTGSLADDHAALTDLYFATGGNTTWLKRTRWLEAAPNSTDVCKWFGVACGPAQCQANATAPPCRVVSLILYKNRLTGTPPPSFGALNALQILDLSANSLSYPVSCSINSNIRTI